MLVIIRSAPDTEEGKRAMKLAQSTSADIILLQNGVYFAQQNKIAELDFTGTAYVLADDRRLRGLKEIDSGGRLKEVTYDGIVDLMVEGDKVIGLF